MGKGAQSGAKLSPRAVLGRILRGRLGGHSTVVARQAKEAEEGQGSYTGGEPDD